MPGQARKPRTTAARQPSAAKKETKPVAVPVDTEDPTLAIPDADGASVTEVDEGNTVADLDADSVKASEAAGVCIACYPKGWPTGADYVGCAHGEWTRDKEDARNDALTAEINAEIERRKHETEAEIEAALAAQQAAGSK